jgi:DNA invertase Pin-like site-specific DNA recombinase
MTIYAYLRVSTRQQGISGLGLEAQRAAVLAAYPHTVEVTEVASAGAGKARPVLATLLDGLVAGDVLVVAKLDRLARSVVDFGQILARAQKEGWSLAIVDMCLDTSTPVGKMTAGMLALVAEFERDMIRERQREAAAARRARGLSGGRRSKLDADTAAAIETMRTTGCSWAAIAEQLNRQGSTTPTGRAWTRESVRAASVVGDADRAARRRAALAQGRAA